MDFIFNHLLDEFEISFFIVNPLLTIGYTVKEGDGKIDFHELRNVYRYVIPDFVLMLLFCPKWIFLTPLKNPIFFYVLFDSFIVFHTSN